MVAACESLGIPVAKQIRIKIRGDITACFADPQDLTEEGRLLLSFFTHIMHFVRDAPEALRRDVVEFLGSESCSEKDDEGRVSVISDLHALIFKR